jgi:(1->4)-alpha-D-glucan 1-alpha-D-glucosylmutase
MRLPVSTYRIQLGAGLSLDRARSLVDYLAALGVDFLYLSPVLAARSGSTHGYDVVDPRRIDPELGSRHDLEELARTLESHGMGLLLDIVPNHMAADTENPWWFDVLSRGRDSAYADFFDIDWSAGGPGLEGRVLLPILGESPAAVAARGDLRAVREGGALLLAYFDRRLPLCARSWPLVLEPALARVDADELGAIVERARALPGLDAAERRRQSEALHARLESLLRAEADVRDAVDAELAAVAREPGRGRLLSLLEEQHYRLRLWNGPLPLNYRRFFDVSGLVGLRVEAPLVFKESHALLLDLVSRGLVHGLRIDHPDGLLDPEGYLERLARSVPGHRPYVVVEKILAGDERLRESWPVAGTTGYEQLDLLGSVLIDPGGRDALLDTYARFTQQSVDFADVAFGSKRHVLERLLAPELAALVRSLSALLDPTAPPDSELEDALTAVIACFSVYRSYVRPGAVRVEGEDRRRIERAVDAAGQRGARSTALEAIRSALLLEPPVAHDDESRAACLELLLRFQQLTGPAAAKGVEDTACYRYLPLACLCEVGGEPGRFGVPVEQFHAHNKERAAHGAGSLSASSTHDTKRGEDVRCRIGVLSEMPERWAEAALRWHALAAPHRASLRGGSAPAAADEYLLFQTLVGAWPDGELDGPELAAFRERIAAYMLKAAREAKRFTSWVDGDVEYEAALVRFVERVLDRAHSAGLVADLQRFVGPVARAGRLASLSMLLLKIAGPGIPDFYQGSELWDGSLVDPDNRRPVDFERRRILLAELSDEQDMAALLDQLGDGRLKLLLTLRGLGLRKRRADLFASGDYLPVMASGFGREQIVAFARTRGDDAVLVAVGRFFSRFAGRPPVGDAWNDTALELPPEFPHGCYRDALTGLELELESRTQISTSRLFARLPYIMMERIP